MSDQKVFARYKANEIVTDLQHFGVKKFKSNITRRKNALRKIIANLVLGNYGEMSLLFSELLKFWQIEDDLEVKRICHEYIRVIGALKPQQAREALPFIMDDFKSRDEKLQIMALRTLVLVPVKELSDQAFDCIISLVNHKSSPEQVTRTAIYALLDLDEIDHERVLGLSSILHDIVKAQSSSPEVIVAALHTLYSIHEKNANMEPFRIPLELAFDMLELLPELNEWNKATVLEVLTTSVVPQHYLDTHEMIELALPYLQQVNTYVVLNSLKFIIYLLNYVDVIKETLAEKLSNSVIALLDKPPELQFLVLRNVILLLLSRESSLLRLDISYFFIEYNDPIYIKDTKLECLYLLANKETLPRILEELEQYATDIDIQMSRKSVRAIGNLAVKLDEDSVHDCVAVLLNLLEFGVDYVVQEIISVFRNILRKYPNNFKANVTELVKHTEVVQEPESKNAMIWIITQYSDVIPNYLELFRVFSSNMFSETLEVQFSILNSAIKFFIRNPTKETEELCMDLLKGCTDHENNPDLRDKTLMYWRLLSLTKTSRISNAITFESLKSVLDGELPLIEMNTKLDPTVLEELELNIGTIVSIYLKPVSHIFRLNKTKLLPQSPILNPNKDLLPVVGNSFPPTGANRDRQNSESQSSTKSRKTAMMDDYDKPAEKINQLKGKRKSSSNNPSKLSRKPSTLLRKLSMKRPFS
ncbi:AEL_HP2_G0027800.mRNA.1.CDS.1 [Saccharomyces cerevisiae]|nr:AEL_HP2_G0027800.mRNA.1.CDS.1 [Saccharomyces cerevisiae]CAI6591995.1 AEL_HP1_G0029540.mRNA.1.CDS.1 [Saccharomyces cerevisiae]CAI6814590.1 AEL_HP2_G0027800.mRNA.1.CDS.1 [Saccharomyces cerevisiae]